MNFIRCFMMFMILSLALVAKGQSYSYELLERAYFYDVDAKLALAKCYYNGSGIAQNYEEAARWFEEAASFGNAEAANMLGMCFYNGKGVKKNYDKAVEWFKKSGEKGYATGQYNLANCYYNGRGVNKSICQAYYWYKQAAAQNYNKASEMLRKFDIPEMQYELAVDFEIHKYYYNAMEWFEKAALNNYKDAKVRLKSLRNNYVIAVHNFRDFFHDCGVAMFSNGNNTRMKGWKYDRYTDKLDKKQKKGNPLAQYLFAKCFSGYTYAYRTITYIMKDNDELIKRMTKVANLPYKKDYDADNYAFRPVTANNAASAAMYYLAEFYYKQGEYHYYEEGFDKSIEWCKKILSKCKKDSWVYRRANDLLEINYCHSKRYALEGINFYKQRNGYRINSRIAGCYIYLEQYDKAIEYYKKDDDYMFEVAGCYELQRNYSKAIEFYENDKSKRNWEIARCYVKQKQYSKAMEHYQKCLIHTNKGDIDTTSMAYKYYTRCQILKAQNRTNTVSTSNPVDFVRQYFYTLNTWFSSNDYASPELVNYYVSDRRKVCRMEDDLAKDIIRERGLSIRNIMPDTYLLYFYRQKRDAALKAEVLDIRQNNSQVYAKVRYTGKINKIIEHYFTVEDNGIVYISSN